MRINERVPNKSNELHRSMDIGHILKSHCQMSWYGICLLQHKWNDLWPKIVVFILNGILTDSFINWSHFARMKFFKLDASKMSKYLETTFNVVIFQLKVYPSKLVCVNTYSCAPQNSIKCDPHWMACSCAFYKTRCKKAIAAAAAAAEAPENGTHNLNDFKTKKKIKQNIPEKIKSNIQTAKKEWA